jgi:hypothetical protein
LGKEHFEQWLYDNAYAEVKHFHGNNGIFASEQYRQECIEKGQTQSFSGVEAQHQNTKAKQAIQTVMYMARTFMVHASLHWTEHGVNDISLWPFAVKHAVWLYNRVPNRESGLTPMELITKQKVDHSDLLGLHVWGCPAYIEALFSNFEFCADRLESGPTPAAAIPIDGAVISDSEDDSSVASGSSESEGGVGVAVAVAVAMAMAMKMVLVIMMPMITMMMAVFLPRLTFLRELRELRELQLHPTLMWVLVGWVLRGNLARD